jgi:hypothetical protein
MSTKKQPKNLKTAKKVIKPIEIEDGTKTEIITPTDDELVLGVEETTQEIKVVDYASISKKYIVTIIGNGRKININGREVGTFLGQNNEARKELKNGAKSVDIEDEKANIIYKIEVL